MMFSQGLIIGAAISALYFFVLRPVLKNAPVFSDAFKKEASLFTQIKTKLVGFKTKILARLAMIGGGFVALYDHALPYVTGQNWTPLLAHMPDWFPPVGIVLFSLLIEWARNATEKAPLVVTQSLDDSGEQKVIGVVPQK